MTLLNTIEINCQGQIRRLELHKGDLTALAPEDSVDVLILSAFPDDYSPTHTSLIGALWRKGISVFDLAKDKAVDLRTAFSCWLSHPIRAEGPAIQFKRILCFEPQVRGDAPDVVGDIFRALAPFLGGTESVRTAAMPIVAAGDQGYSVATMLPSIMDAAVHWMRIGFPLEVLKVFAYSDSAACEAEELFARFKSRYAPSKTSRSVDEYDVFISYSRPDADAADTIQDCLAQEGLRFFVDTRSLKKGAAWQSQIFNALDSCSRMIAVYSPAYVQSKVCQEEFNIAWARGRKHDLTVIYPIYWLSADLPTYMEMLNYVDCREANREKLPSACTGLLREFQA